MPRRVGLVAEWGMWAGFSLGGEGLVSGGVGGRFVSRSAPDTSEGDEGVAQRLRERKSSNVSTISGHHITTVSPSTRLATTASGGYYITVLDLSPLLVSAGKEAASSLKCCSANQD